MKGTIYILRAIGMAGPVKIGLSVLPPSRLATYMQWAPYPLEIVGSMDGDHILEARIHALLLTSHSHHEWFRATPEVERLVSEVCAGNLDQDRLPPPIRLYRRRAA